MVNSEMPDNCGKGAVGEGTGKTGWDHSVRSQASYTKEYVTLLFTVGELAKVSTVTFMF